MCLHVLKPSIPVFAFIAAVWYAIVQNTVVKYSRRARLLQPEVSRPILRAHVFQVLIK